MRGGRELEGLLVVFPQLDLFELVVAETGAAVPAHPPHVPEDLTATITVGALLICASVASVLCAEHRRDTPIPRGVTLEGPFLAGRRLV
jgi:hypothetical protein